MTVNVIGLTIQCNVTALDKEMAYWMLDFGLATDASLTTKIVCRHVNQGE
jgi:hypothetical protein